MIDLSGGYDGGVHDTPAPLRTGSLFSGYRGLDLGIESVLHAETAWVSDIDPGPRKLLAHHWPNVPNLGDITTVDWSTVEPVQILTGGFPCQDVSLAGLRRGMHPDTRSGLWSHMALAVDTLRPRLVVGENVRGLLSAEAAGSLEPCTWCLGDDDHVPLRALGGVLGDLADIGYDAGWVGLAASDVGACHRRFRVFFAAWPRGTDPRDLPLAPHPGGETLRLGSGLRQGDPAGIGRGRPDDHDPSAVVPDAEHDERQEDHPHGPSPAGGRGGPVAHPSGIRGERRGGPGDVARPAGTSQGDGAERERDGDAADHRGPALADPRGVGRVGGPSELGPGGNEGVRGQTVDHPGDSLVAWGEYEPAIRRWESIIGRPAPSPTEPGRGGAQRLSPRFTEWMMGVPEGHIAAVPGLSRTEALKLAGNGVVPQQAAAALRHLLGTA